MKFKGLLDLYQDKDIIDRLLDLYPNQVKNKDGYIKALLELRKTKPTRTNLKLQIKHIVDNLDKKNIEEYERVDGVSEKTDKYGNNQVAIEYTFWGQWLSMPITKPTLENYFEIDILAYCLWEMTWGGYSNKEVQKQWEEIAGRVKKAKKQIKKELKEKIK